MFLEIKKLVIDLSVRGLCVKPYPNHPKGCPNFHVKSGCPPTCKKISETIDLSKPVYVIFNIFDFASHIAKMKEKHPSWTDRQLRCCLCWQPKARKQLRAEIREFLRKHRDYIIISTPEAQGVNIAASMASIGHILEWPPETKTYQVALAGIPKALGCP